MLVHDFLEGFVVELFFGFADVAVDLIEERLGPREFHFRSEVACEDDFQSRAAEILVEGMEDVCLETNFMVVLFEGWTETQIQHSFVDATFVASFELNPSVSHK